MRKLIAGNWKMNGDRAALVEIDAIAEASRAYPDVDVALCPPVTLIALASARQPNLLIGAQDTHHEPSGAYTGSISAAMLRDAGAALVLVGHSERRADLREDDALVRAKAEAAIAAGLIAIVCVGETGAERGAGSAEAVVESQLAGSIPQGATSAALVVAYEPVWAIGTGRTPGNGDIAAMHAVIRAKLSALVGDAGPNVRILYGGSVSATNARAILALPDVNGALVGGASLTAADFVPIIAAAG